MRVLVVMALPEVQEVAALDLEDGATVADALAASGMSERYPDVPLTRVGIWGRRRELDAVVRDGDRVEVYRALRADAKAMRRARAGLRLSTRSRSGP